ncbi:META domain-containing protein [Halomonas sp. V046]|uniref:META domain-containing protein n=1 Tax=Halomonas sp. V046 TaxID=3459611 RepID=UPI0040443580
MALLRLRRLGTVSMLALVLSACSSQPAPSVSGSSDGASASVSSPVVGKRWNLLLIGTSDRISMPSTPYFTVDSSGKLSGSDGCNQLTGQVSFGENQRIDIDNLGATRMACAKGQDAQQVHDLLDNAYRYLIDHDRLVFFGPNSLVLGGFRLAN